MTNPSRDTSCQPQPNKPVYRITASLMNDRNYIFDCIEYVREAEGDTISLEDKQADKMNEMLVRFATTTLVRAEKEDTPAMARGREYESMVYAGGDDEFSPIVKGGTYQVRLEDYIDFGDFYVHLVGVLDALKAGHIYDIKRVGRYKYPKYKNSHQHPIYFRLVPEARDFTYLICSGEKTVKHEQERYLRENCESVVDAIKEFYSYLRCTYVNNTCLWDLYREYRDEDHIERRRKESCQQTSTISAATQEHPLTN